MKSHMNIPVFIPHLGCPHNCAFCSQRSVTNVQTAPSPESVAFYIRRCLKSRGDRRAEVAFFGGSFTGLSPQQQKAYLAAALPFLESGEVESIRVSTRPDFISQKIVDMLKAYRVRTVELGAQSMDDSVLRAVARGHTARDTEKAAAIIRAAGLELGLQMMTGLPESTPKSEMYTAKEFVRLGAKCARIYPTVVFYDTPLYARFLSGDYAPPDVSETVPRAAAACRILEDGGVRLLRIGLQETDTLGAKVAGGAYHPAMGSLVRSRIWRDRLEDAVCSLSQGGASQLTVTCAQRLCSLIVGHRRENFMYLTEKYKVTLTLLHGSTGCTVAAGGRKIEYSDRGNQDDCNF